MTQQPTETPPAEGSTGMALSEHANDANSGPIAGNRTPMTITLVALALLGLTMLAVVAYGVVQASR